MARVWFGTLWTGSIDSFEELARQFLTQFMPNRRRRCPVAHLLTVKQREDKSLKTYLTHFNKERLTTDNQDEKITLAALLGEIWPRNPFMAELDRKTPSTLREFLDRADDFVNPENTLKGLVELMKGELKAKHKGSLGDKKVAPNH
ncbi:uncharacterized protein LOC121236604 [Juglans microcarpa x Juglans regia]|uniref:uncharacterized protein LOC121236604 n=1 Tax=Juglans microcarpa x Juglans regia TaxID=2249226 RepID=UPI001B7F68CD|nr:uncharacterized protein LOC121236604 [Juglans microcarpa x Juglans regia]